ncbi:MAG: endonuclease/exonuclease/phosphatase family protein [Bacteroidia bacterium]
MKKFLFTILLLLLNHFTFSQSFRLITYNLRYDNADDGVNQWGNRREKVAELIKKYNPDIFGVQEGLHNMLEDLKILLPEYNFVGVGRDDGKTKGEYSAIFYKRDLIKVEQDSTFWLSKTPAVAGSKSWDAAITRICTWAKFKDIKSGKQFYLFNTHFDHMGDTARLQSALLLKKTGMMKAGGLPIVFMGDFNSEPEELPYKVMTNNNEGPIKDSFYSAIKNAADTLCTFTGFEVNGKICERIDYIFTDQYWLVKFYNIIRDNDGTYYYSDHLPVMCEVEIVK